MDGCRGEDDLGGVAVRALIASRVLCPGVPTAAKAMRDNGGDEGCDICRRAFLGGPGLGVSGLKDRVGDPLEGVIARLAWEGEYFLAISRRNWPPVGERPCCKSARVVCRGLPTTIVAVATELP